MSGTGSTYGDFTWNGPAAESPGAVNSGQTFLVSAPEMAVLGSGNEIIDGDTSPTPTDGTDFGSLDVTTGSQQNVFSIANSGNADLILMESMPNRQPEGGNNYVVLTGDTADFTVAIQPTSPIPSGSPSEFAITFNPTTTGLRTATVTISNNDSNENPYNFTIQGTGTAATSTPTPMPSPSITMVKTVGTTPGVCSGTTSITVPAGTTVYYCYAVTNTGNVAFGLHNLSDNILGTIFTGLNFNLTPGNSVNTVQAGLSIPFVANATTTNIGSWLAYNQPGAQAAFQASATVTVLQPTPTASASPTPTPNPTPGAQQALYGIQNGFGTQANNRIYQIDRTNGNVSNIQTITMPGRMVLRAYSLSARPGDGVLFGVLEVENILNSPEGIQTRNLVTINPTTGVATNIGILTANIAAISFRDVPMPQMRSLESPESAVITLYGASDYSGPSTTQRTLFTIDQTTASLTSLFQLSNENCGVAIAFAPDDFLYRASGGSCFDAPEGGGAFQKIDVDTQTVVNLPNAPTEEVFALGYSTAAGQMYMN
ncbi:MAG: choice-of-anchor D domain-containing protein, partial [Microgenomates group bacterium]